MTFYSVLNQIFYPYKKFDDPAMIESLEKWMFIPLKETSDRDLKSDLLEIPASIVSIVEPEPEIKPREQRAFSPKKQDTLFWCAYVAYHGEAEYWLIGNKYKNTELSEKQKVIDFIQKNKTGFKSAYPKMTNVKIQEIMSELMLDKKTSLKTFMSLCVFYKFHAILTYNKTYIVCAPHLEDSTRPIFLFIRSDDGHFSFKPLETKEDVDEIKTTHILVESDPSKPLKAASNYKIDDLKHMANILGIAIGEKQKKQEIYDEILKKIKY